MIIDGVEVLYAMRNGKIVDPNIPTDGLVCYLDARGKTNTDKHRETLLDLSGNGNHGTLRNFSFMDGSGYENGGLKFDGVDDATLGGPVNALSTPAFTYMVEFTIDKTAKEQSANIALGMRLYMHSFNNFIYCDSTVNIYGNTHVPVTVAVGKHKVILAYTKDLTDAEFFIDGVRYRATNTTDDQGLPHTHKGIGDGAFRIGYRGEKIISKQVLWERRLTEQEIQQLMEV